MNNRRANGWLIVTIVYTITTFALSSIANPPAFLVNKYRLDWWMHGIQYGLLAFLMMNYFASIGDRMSSLAAAITTFLFCGAVGALNELLQKFIPKRYPSIGDEVANLVGAAFFIGLFYLIRLFRRGEPKN